MNTIQNILKSYKTDKANETEHSYGDFYADLFSKFDRHGEIRILKLGFRGGSLLAWKEYFPNADVIGVDIVDDRLEDYKSDKVEFIKEDLKVAYHMLKGGEKFDIIIDDSDHSDDTMAWITRHYFDLLKENGVIVFEDVQIPDVYLSKIEDALPLGAEISTHDFRHVKGRHDDFIITVRP